MTLSNRGFSSLETMAAMIAVVAVVSTLLLVAYLSFAKIWIQHVSHEALLCTAKGHSTFQCKTQMKNRLSILGGFLKPTFNFKAERDRGQYQLQVQYKILNWNFSTLHKLSERHLWTHN